MFDLDAYLLAPGLAVDLIRDGVVQLESKRHLKGKAQLVLRGVFAKLFPRDRVVSLVTEKVARDPRWAGYEVTQFVVDGGWAGLAMAPERKTAADWTAQKRSTEATRSAR